MKTLQEWKDEVAKWHEFESFDTARNSSSPVDWALVILDEAAELYAKQYKDENSRLLEEKVKLIEESTWISVTDRLPERDTWVLIYSESAFRFSKQMVGLHEANGRFLAKGFTLRLQDEVYGLLSQIRKDVFIKFIHRKK